MAQLAEIIYDKDLIPCIIKIIDHVTDMSSDSESEYQY